MSRYRGPRTPQPDRSSGLGVLLVNLGTPEAPTRGSVRRYLKEFLADPRVVEVPRLVWWPILNLIILNTRPARSAHAYQKIWCEDGSPLRHYSRLQAQALEAELALRLANPVPVVLAMRYGKPSIAVGLRALQAQGRQRILILPLYPQYSATTTASVFDAVADEFKTWRWVPEHRFIADYHDDAGYIAAMAAQIRAYWAEHGRSEQLVLSFHGIPQRYALQGDPYPDQCQVSARQLAQALGLEASQWQVTFQSRFGRAAWLEPYTDQTMARLPASGIKEVDVFCPGFAADCLETLEEIALQNRKIFLDAGGRRFTYIPALNDTPAHIEALGRLVTRQIQGWVI